MLTRSRSPLAGRRPARLNAFRPSAEAVEARTLMSTFTVTSNADSGPRVAPTGNPRRQHEFRPGRH